MKKYITLALCSCFLLACIISKEPVSFSTAARVTLHKKVDTIINLLELAVNTSDVDSLKTIFISNRIHYKAIEPFVEYYFQGFSRRINGPALPEIKTDDNMVNEASGYQVLEESIFSDSVDISALKKQIKILITDLQFVKQNSNDLPFQDHHFYELIQHQFIRIATLGITGFDSPVAQLSIQEAGYSLVGITDIYSKFCSINQIQPNSSLLSILKEAVKYTQTHNDFNQFQRNQFIKDYLMPLSILWENSLKKSISVTPELSGGKVFAGHLADLMQGKKYNPDAFSPYADAASTPQKIALGKKLFYETSLSRSKNMSCATCHQPDKAFADSKKTSVAQIHDNAIGRNSPSILYAAFQRSFFYDLRAQDLENQIESVFKNPKEFNLTDQELQQRLKLNSALASDFALAFNGEPAITTYNVRNAIATYVRSLMPFSSRVDDYFMGAGYLTPNEINGFNLFAGKAKCATCHFIPLYNGTIPPWFNTTESEVIGVPTKDEWKNATIDGDVGRYAFNQLPQLKFSFKTPTVRNIEKTAPYMHNGVYTNLDQVLKFYELGGGKGIGVDLEYQTLPFDNLQLTKTEKQDIIRFLLALTDKNESL
jgi:cytochrome c peroxidase